MRCFSRVMFVATLCLSGFAVGRPALAAAVLGQAAPPLILKQVDGHRFDLSALWAKWSLSISGQLVRAMP